LKKNDDGAYTTPFSTKQQTSTKTNDSTNNNDAAAADGDANATSDAPERRASIEARAASEQRFQAAALDALSTGTIFERSLFVCFVFCFLHLCFFFFLHLKS
jgi:hypothetical protein